MTIPDCLFCKIVRKEIPANEVLRDEYVVAFRDLNPQAPTHILVVPTLHADHLSDFASKADGPHLTRFLQAAAELGARFGPGGYRVVIGPPFEEYPGADAVHDVERFHALLEAQIRRIPEQYLWMHRRFKGLTADYPDYYGRDSRARGPACWRSSPRPTMRATATRASLISPIRPMQ